MTVLGSWCRPVEEWFPDRASGSLYESWGSQLCWGPWSCLWLWHVVVWVAWWGSVVALPCWMLPCFDFPIWASLHFLIIFVVTIPFRRYCPSLPAFSIPTAGCRMSNAVNTILSLLRGTAFPSATSDRITFFCNLKHNTYGSFLAEEFRETTHRNKDMDVEGMKVDGVLHKLFVQKEDLRIWLLKRI